MKIKVVSGTQEVSIGGLGLFQTNDWHEVTKKQEEEF